MMPGQKYFFENFRQRAVWNLAVENFFELRISTSNDIADNHHIGRRLQMRGFERMKEGYAQAFEQRRRRRIHT